MRCSDAQGRKIHVALVLPMRLRNAEPQMPPLRVSGKEYPKTGGYLCAALAQKDVQLFYHIPIFP